MSRPSAAPHWPVPVVAMISSTGGLDAVSRILEKLPADLPAAIVVLRHHSPHAPDLLAKVLRPHTEFAVDTPARRNR